MKAFITGCAALLLVIGAVAASALNVYSTMDHLDAYTTEMPNALETADDAESARRLVGEAEKYWLDRTFKVSLSLSHKETEYIDLSLHRIRAALDANDSGSYAEALASFRHYVRRLREEEKLTVENML